MLNIDICLKLYAKKLPLRVEIDIVPRRTKCLVCMQVEGATRKAESKPLKILPEGLTSGYMDI